VPLSWSIARSVLAIFFAAAGIAQAGAPLRPAQKNDNLESFEIVWRTVRDRHPDAALNGLNWQAVHERTRPRIADAGSMDEVRALLTDMLAQLRSSHYAIIASDLYQPLADAANRAASSRSDATPGFTPVIIEGKAVVASVEPDSPAARAGIHPGMVLDGIDGAKVAAMLRLADNVKDQESQRIVARSVARKLSGPPEAQVQLDIVDENGQSRHIALDRAEPKGKLVSFGNLPETRVFFEARRLAGGAGYIRFNEFLDPVSIMPQFEAAVKNFASAPGIVLDLRGNPGGIGVMAMGIAGFFIDKEGQKLGEMKMRETTLKFVIFPRAETFAGPLAILVDAGSASTAEILAQGLQDLKRARIFGTRTAGAALPSDIIRLPNGDGFQFAQASYMSQKGRVLEGSGVAPDVEVRQTQQALLAGHDPVVEAAESWIQSLR
jgi:carboxyl-terminal processing protease